MFMKMQRELLRCSLPQFKPLRNEYYGKIAVDGKSDVEMNKKGFIELLNFS